MEKLKQGKAGKAKEAAKNLFQKAGVIFERVTGYRNGYGAGLDRFSLRLEEAALRGARKSVLTRLRDGSIKPAHRDDALDTIGTIDKNLASIRVRRDTYSARD